ncbi:D-ribose pyranase [Enterococcus montenegrensis]|uniref:D-ribose pyranase n=1 Tax=Enterococcus montenegrensis TaxID=3031993 RepID=UPI00249DB7E9|nr:D-ribose pyranase [Enterococcus montenegrensis]WHA09997.1 D-ribose pyranase [Enterococcus montenegrensis]
MKKNGILNSEITKVLADLGHTDQITIGDAGLPVPHGVAKIDLALKFGLPSFNDVLLAVLSDMAIEKVVLAEEIKTQNAQQLQAVLKALPKGVEIVYVSHTEFKKQTQNSKAVIRTGEVTPYSNIILQSAVIF